MSLRLHKKNNDCTLPTAAYRWQCASLLCLTLCLFEACGSPNTPLDAETRSRIDSVVTVQTSRLNIHLDSVCNAQRLTQLPHLVDSIKKIRLQEIEEQLKTIPK